MQAPGSGNRPDHDKKSFDYRNSLRIKGTTEAGPERRRFVRTSLCHDSSRAIYAQEKLPLGKSMTLSLSVCTHPDKLSLDGSPVDAQHAQMSRRSTQQQKIDGAAFPVRILVVVPETGFGMLLGDMSDWLNQHIGRGRYAHHSAGKRIIGERIVDAVAFFFVSPRAAAEFVEKFPVELADGTTSITYSSPGVTPDTGN